MRRDTAANWATANPTLAAGELGLDTTAGRFKIGDGTTAWTSLGYAPNTIFSGSGTPSSGLGVNGDVYFDVTNKGYFVKASGSWGSIISLQGTTGTTGATGPGVATGGSTGQVLLKNSATNFDTSFANTPVDGSTLEITGSNVARQKDGGTTNAKLADMAQATFKMRAAAAGTGVPIDGTATQAKTALAIANTDVSGLGTLSTQSGTFSGTSSGTNTGDVTLGAVGAVPNANAASLSGQALTLQPASASFPGLVTAAQFIKLSNLVGINTGDQTLSSLGAASSGRFISTTAPLTGGGGLSADLTLAISAATQSTAGSMSALDKKKLDNLPIDVTANSFGLVLTTNTAAQNITAINLILAGAPNGSTIFFPHGLYLFNAAWTYPAATAKMFTFLGEGSNRAGSPATTFTELQWTANVGGDIITLPGSGNGWYTEFDSLTFTSSATQSAGALVNVNGNVGTNFTNCSFQSTATGNTFFDVLLGGGVGGGSGNNSWNSAVIDNCSFQGFTNSAIRINAAGSSLVVSNCVIQGQWGSTTQIAAACVSGGWVGALQLVACDILGGVNNLLLNPVTASSEVCASVQCTNTYFDFAGGSCIKITGTGATVRSKWDTCTFTTSNAGAGSFSAVEIAGSFVYAAGAQDLAFVNCNIYNTFGATGTTNGVLITNAADVSFTNCKVAGWTNGYNITAMASNKTNVQVIAGTVGPSGGFAGNTTGINVAAGAFKGLQIRGCNVIGNTTNLTLGAVTVNSGEGSLFAITENAGINPKGAVTTPTYPATTVTVTNTTGFRCQVMHKLAATTTTALTLNGVATIVPNVIQTISYIMEPGGTVAIAFTGTAGTWTWVGL